MQPFWQTSFGNPSSLHSKGSDTRLALNKSRDLVAKFLNCQFREVIFTSCATEANNLALKGSVVAWRLKNPNKNPHIIVSPIEHHCVSDTAKHLEKQGVKVSWLRVDK